MWKTTSSLLSFHCLCSFNCLVYFKLYVGMENSNCCLQKWHTPPNFCPEYGFSRATVLYLSQGPMWNKGMFSTHQVQFTTGSTEALVLLAHGNSSWGNWPQVWLRSWGSEQGAFCLLPSPPGIFLAPASGNKSLSERLKISVIHPSIWDFFFHFTEYWGEIWKS